MIILIHGLKRHGKDSLADLLVELEPGLKKIGFADPMKRILAKTLGISLEDLDKLKNDESIKLAYAKSPDSVKLLETTFRNVLQWFGTEAMKPEFGDEVWAEKLLRDYKLQYMKTGKEPMFVVPDFRLQEEYDYLEQELGSADIVTIKITRPNIEPTGDVHSSENGLKDFKFDYEIENEGTLDDLRVSAVDFLDFLTADL